MLCRGWGFTGQVANLFKSIVTELKVAGVDATNEACRRATAAKVAPRTRVRTHTCAHGMLGAGDGGDGRGQRCEHDAADDHAGLAQLPPAGKNR